MYRECESAPCVHYRFTFLHVFNIRENFPQANESFYIADDNVGGSHYPGVPFARLLSFARFTLHLTSAYFTSRSSFFLSLSLSSASECCTSRTGLCASFGKKLLLECSTAAGTHRTTLERHFGGRFGTSFCLGPNPPFRAIVRTAPLSHAAS